MGATDRIHRKYDRHHVGCVTAEHNALSPPLNVQQNYDAKSADRTRYHGGNGVNECVKLMAVDYWSPFMTTPSNRQQAIALLDKLEDDRLPDAIAALEALNQPVHRTASAAEADLIRLINHRLPIAQRQRLEVLRDRLEAETLTEDERAELLAMVEVVEMQDAERARAMFELATLRGVDLTVIVQEFRGAIAAG
jgi:hypothetical protein